MKLLFIRDIILMLINHVSFEHNRRFDSLSWHFLYEVTLQAYLYRRFLLFFFTILVDGFAQVSYFLCGRLYMSQN